MRSKVSVATSMRTLIVIGVAASAVCVAVARARDWTRPGMARVEVGQVDAGMWALEGGSHFSRILEFADGQVVVVVVAKASSATEELGLRPRLRGCQGVVRRPKGRVEVRT